MTLVRFNPYNKERYYDGGLDRFFECYDKNNCNGYFTPASEIIEHQDEFIINVELAGVAKEDVSIELKENILTVKGDKKKADEKEDEKLLSSNRAYGSFEKQFSVPVAIKEDKIEAGFHDGILTLVIPKAEGIKPKKIDIN